MKIAFYKKSKTLFGRLICFKQRLAGIPERYARYSHVEIVFDKDYCFSSSEQDGGCRFKHIEFNPENWDLCTLSLSDKKKNNALYFCLTQDGNRYNKVGIFFAQILNFNKKKEGTWFCSEIVTRALQEAKMLCGVNSLFTKPGELAMYLEEEGYLIESLQIQK